MVFLEFFNIVLLKTQFPGSCKFTQFLIKESNNPISEVFSIQTLTCATISIMLCSFVPSPSSNSIVLLIATNFGFCFSFFSQLSLRPEFENSLTSEMGTTTLSGIFIFVSLISGDLIFSKPSIR